MIKVESAKEIEKSKRKKKSKKKGKNRCWPQKARRNPPRKTRFPLSFLMPLHVYVACFVLWSLYGFGFLAFWLWIGYIWHSIVSTHYILSLCLVHVSFRVYSAIFVLAASLLYSNTRKLVY
jgi:hypothetical protein